jgi:hypothetical protein
MTIGSLFHTVAARIAAFFGSHMAVFSAVIKDAQEAVATAQAVAAAADPGELPGLQALLAEASDGLGKIETAVQAESTAETLTQQAQTAAALVSGLATSTNDIGIKNAKTKTAIGAVLVKVNSVVGALETAATAAN